MLLTFAITGGILTALVGQTLAMPLAGVFLVASVFFNWFWRILVFVLAYNILPIPWEALSAPAPLVSVLLFLAIFSVPTFALLGVRKAEKVEGAVFVTGCDSGMGFWTAALLADQGYQVFAGCFLDDSEGKLKAHAKTNPGNLHVVKLDVTSEKSVSEAAEAARKGVEGLKTGLVGIINCAGVGYNGPAEYFPMDMYKRQMDVNFFGYVRVVQALMPLLRESVQGSGKGGVTRRGRVVFIGTGGGVLSPAPPLLSAYMASKWAIEAFCGCMRLEMQLNSVPVDCCMLNPGFVKPTMLMEIGLKMTQNMWAQCAKVLGSNKAEDEYGPLLSQFIEYSANEPGTHVSEVAKTMGAIMRAHRPNATYKVGPDSMAAPYVGLLPTAIREFIVKYSMYKKVGSV